MIGIFAGGKGLAKVADGKLNVPIVIARVRGFRFWRIWHRWNVQVSGLS